MIFQHPLYPVVKEITKLLNSLAVGAIILAIGWGHYKGSDTLILSAASWVPTYLKVMGVYLVAAFLVSYAYSTQLRRKAKDALPQ